MERASPASPPPGRLRLGTFPLTASALGLLVSIAVGCTTARTFDRPFDEVAGRVESLYGDTGVTVRPPSFEGTFARVRRLVPGELLRLDVTQVAGLGDVTREDVTVQRVDDHRTRVTVNARDYGPSAPLSARARDLEKARLRQIVRAVEEPD